MYLLLVIKLVKDALELTPELWKVPEGYTLFDIDNFSDSLVVSTALRAIQESEQVRVKIYAEEDAQLGATLKILTALLRYKGKLEVIVTGKHEQLERMVKKFNQH